MVDVVTTAKIDLKEGEIIDGLGHYKTYGLCENYDISQKESLLPIGLAEGCRLKRNINKDSVLTYDDVELPEGRLSDKLRLEQNQMFKS
jgi:predicted homoserine dehydrogenase-like protein